MIKAGIKYSLNLDIDSALKNGFDEIEVSYVDIESYKKESSNVCKVKGLNISLKDVDSLMFSEILNTAYIMKCSYIVVNTLECNDLEKLFYIVKDNAEIIKEKQINILIENSFIKTVERYLYGVYSDINDLVDIVEKLNNQTESTVFGICINVGHANIIGSNVRCMIEGAGKYLRLMHMNDNDGVSNQYQMPYTFTTGRGLMSTDWFRIVGALVRTHYDGDIVFDTTGLINRTPKRLQDGMIGLLRDIMTEWNEQFDFEELLQNSKNVILFGSGKMAQNYMLEWGKKYPPIFYADNNSDAWGEKRMDIEVKSPQEILTIDPEGRLVFICNLFYNEIGEQLESMGIDYKCYWDEYYL